MAFENIKSGCTKYVHATLDIYFQPDHVDCEHCPALETYARKQCRRTGEYLIDTRLTGWQCPLKFESEDK